MIDLTISQPTYISCDGLHDTGIEPIHTLRNPRLENLANVAGFASRRGRARVSSEAHRMISWRNVWNTDRAGGIQPFRQPRYPRRGGNGVARRPVALRPHLSMGLLNATDYAQSPNAGQGRTMQLGR